MVLYWHRLEQSRVCFKCTAAGFHLRSYFIPDETFSFARGVQNSNRGPGNPNPVGWEKGAWPSPVWGGGHNPALIHHMRRGGAWHGSAVKPQCSRQLHLQYITNTHIIYMCALVYIHIQKC
uniref:Uncharacterized protein n=1 Tax=Crocodylus porosus TaxID=8502 RepID=A0A7M4G083_CROPO